MGTAQRKESKPLGQKKPKERKKLDSDLSSLLGLRRRKCLNLCLVPAGHFTPDASSSVV